MQKMKCVVAHAVTAESCLEDISQRFANTSIWPSALQKRRRQPLYEGNTLLNAASLIYRTNKI